MKSRPLLILAMVVMTVAVYYLMHLKRKNQMELITEAETGEITYRDSEVEIAMRKAALRFEEAQKALEAGELMLSFNAFHQGRGEVSIYLDQHGDRLVAKGETMAQWYEGKVGPYLKEIAVVYSVMLENMGKGEADPGEVKDLANFFSSDALPGLKKLYEEKLEQIKKARVRQAPDWFRLHVYGADKDFLNLAQSKIAARLKIAPGIKLVTGYSLSPGEQRAIWKSLEVPVNIENASYGFEGKGKNAYQFVQPNIPKSVKVGFKLEGVKTVLTNWDELPPIMAEIEVPASILLKEGSDGEAQAKKIAEQHRQKLLASLGEAIDALPELILFPEIDINSAPMVKDGRLDRQVVMAIALADRERVLADLSQLAEEGIESSHGDVAWLAVSLGMEELAGFVAEKLPGLERKIKSEILRELERRPHYGDFEPLLATVNHVDPRQPSPSQAILALGAHLDEKKVKEVFLKKVNDTSNAGRQNYVKALVRSLSREELVELVPLWLTDSDENFARQVWTNIRNTDMDFAESQMVKLFSKVSPGVQRGMLQGFRYNANKQTEGLLEILTTTASQNENANTKQTAVSILIGAAHVTEIWDFLNSYVQSENDARMSESIKSRLIYSLRRAHPDDAEEVFLKWLDDSSGQVRFAAVMGILDRDDDKKEKLQLLADRLKTEEDSEVLRGTVQAAYQFWKIRKGWDAEYLYDPLSAILQMGLQSSDAAVQKKSKEVISRAIQGGDPRYGELGN